MDHLPIRINTLRGEDKINFNVYIKVDGKFFLYLHQGNSFEGAKLKSLKSRQLKKLYILPEDETKYMNYVRLNLESAYDDKSGREVGDRAEVIQGEQQIRTEEVLAKPAEFALYEAAKLGAEKYVRFLMNNSGATQSILTIANNDHSVAQHGVSVATFAVAIAQKLKIGDEKTLQLMTLGALVHDIGHQNTPLDLSKPKSQQTPAEKKIYERHPGSGADTVQDKHFFDPMVLNIIAQHEECSDGSGFPSGLREGDMDPLITVVCSANALDRLITFEKVPKDQVGKKLLLERMGRHPLTHLQFLSELLKKMSDGSAV